MNPRRIDLNADLGEASADDGVGLARETALLDLVSSVNIACGGHAGDGASMRRTLRAAGARGLALGAHPSIPDRTGFGRRAQPLSLDTLRGCIAAQVGTLAGHAARLGLRLRHVKPHGALYNLAADDAAVADAVLDAVAAVDARLAIVALAGGVLLERARQRGFSAIAEGFIDRGYDGARGRLLPRDQPGAVIVDPAAAVTQALALAEGTALCCPDGGALRQRIDTLCVHGDGDEALVLIARVRSALESSGWTISAPNAAKGP